MRALFFDGRSDRRVKVPTWVAFRPLTLGVVLCSCSRCGGEERFDMPRRDTERGMGRFALWHDRCKDRSTFVVRPGKPAAGRVA